MKSQMTNNAGLPNYLYNLLSHEWYSGVNAEHDFSVTQMLNPIIMTILQNRHKDEIVEDVVDQYVKILGVGVHMLSEIANKDKGFILEKREYTKILGRTISGQVDLFIPSIGKMIDYKITKASTYIYGDRLEKYKHQLNFNKYLFEKAGHKVNSLEIAELYRDWDEKEAKLNPKYPKSPIQIIPIATMSNSLIEYEMQKYVAEYERLINVPDEKLPFCSAEDRWERGGNSALMKRGGKKAIKLFNSNSEAEEYRKKYYDVNDSSIYIEDRPVTPTKCISWCNVNKWCPFYKEYIKNQEKINVENTNNKYTEFGL